MRWILGHAFQRLQIRLQIAVAGIARNPLHRNIGNLVTCRHYGVDQPIRRQPNQKILDDAAAGTLDNLHSVNVRASLTQCRGDRTQSAGTVEQRNPQQMHTMIIAHRQAVSRSIAIGARSHTLTARSISALPRVLAARTVIVEGRSGQVGLKHQMSWVRCHRDGRGRRRPPLRVDGRTRIRKSPGNTANPPPTKKSAYHATTRPLGVVTGQHDSVLEI